MTTDREFQFHGTFTTPWTKPTHTATYGCINIWMKHRSVPYANMHGHRYISTHAQANTLQHTHTNTRQFSIPAVSTFGTC